MTTTVRLDWRGEEALEAYRAARDREHEARRLVELAEAQAHDAYTRLLEWFDPDASEYVLRNEVVARRFSDYGIWVVDPT